MKVERDERERKGMMRSRMKIERRDVPFTTERKNRVMRKSRGAEKKIERP